MLVAAQAAPAVAAVRQDKPLLAIMVSATVVSPGSTLTVTATSPTGAQFEGVLLIGTDPIGIVAVEKSMPATFRVPIPMTYTFGSVTLTAIGRTLSGQEVTVGTEIEIRRADLPTKLAAMIPGITFLAQGDDTHVTILADFADGSRAYVTESSILTYSSTSPEVATVGRYGHVSAVGPGRASIVVTYGNAPGSPRLTIPVTVPAPRFKVSPNSVDFGRQQIGTAASRQMTLTNTTGEPLNISEVTTFPGFSQSNTCKASSPLPAGASCTVTVTFAPDGLRPFDGFLRMLDDVGFVGFRLTGTGVAQPVPRDR